VRFGVAAVLSILLFSAHIERDNKEREAAQAKQQAEGELRAEAYRVAVEERTKREAAERARKEADEAAKAFGTNRVAMSAKLSEAEASIRKESWYEASNAAKDVFERLRPVLTSSIAKSPEVIRLNTRLQQVQERVAEHDRRVAQDARMFADASAESDLVVVRSSWQKGGFDTVALWTVTIKNNSVIAAYKDIEYETSYSAASGTDVDDNSGKILDLLEPGKTRTFEVNDGFVRSQASRARFDITGATKERRYR